MKNLSKLRVARLIRKYCNGANTYHTYRRSLRHVNATPQDYCCYRATDIFEASEQL